MTPKVAKSKSELSGPRTSMYRRMNAMFQRRGLRRYVRSTRSAGIATCETS
jgi:hypothetical protein